MKPLTSISFLLSLAIVMATAATAAATEDETANYLIEVEAPPTGVSCASYQLGILTAALGSEEKAKEALLYNYKNVLSGFSARLTPSQLKALEKQPAVTRVLPSANLKLMSTTYEGVS